MYINRLREQNISLELIEKKMRANRSDGSRCSKEICQVFEIKSLNSKTPVNLDVKCDSEVLFPGLSKRKKKRLANESHEFNSYEDVDSAARISNKTYKPIGKYTNLMVHFVT